MVGRAGLLLAMLQLLFFLLPLGLDTLGISISLGIKSSTSPISGGEQQGWRLPLWLNSAILFSLAETTMPLFGLAIGYAASLVISDIMRFIGPLILIGLGLWELWEEIGERLSIVMLSAAKQLSANRDRPLQDATTGATQADKANEAANRFQWGRQLLLALSVSLDELAVGFSLGTVTVAKSINPVTLCILIGVQGFLMTLIGIASGRILRTRLRAFKDWSELLSGILLIGLGIWLLVT
ncbi:MAG: hypothetical protein NVSMB27_14150 [Ktedonobacteraceae bacterium]